VRSYADDNRTNFRAKWQSVFTNRSQIPSLQNSKTVFSQAFQLPGAARLHPQSLHTHHFCCSPRVWQGEQGVSLFSIRGHFRDQSNLQDNWEVLKLPCVGPATAPAASLKEHPNVLFPMKRRMEEKGIIQHLKVLSVFSFSFTVTP